MSLSLGLGLALTRNKGGKVYSPAAKALFARMSVQPDATFKAAYDAFLKDSAVAAVLAKLDAFYLGAGPSAQAACLNLCGADSATMQGTVGHSPRFGFTSNGSGAYIDSGRNPAGQTWLTQNSAGYGLYLTSAPTTSQSVIGLAGTSANFRLSTSDTGNFSARVNDGSSLADVTPGAAGLWQVNRTASNARAAYRNSAQANGTPSTTASTARSANNICLFRENTNHTSSGATVAAWWFGSPLNTTEQTALKTALDAFLDAVRPYYYLVIGSGQSNMARQNLISSTAGSGDDSAGSDAWTRVFNPAIRSGLDSARTRKPNTPTFLNSGSGQVTAFGGSSVLNTQAGQNYWSNYPTLTDGVRLTAWKAVVNALDLSKMDGVIICWAQGENEVSNLEAAAPLADWKAATKWVWAQMRATIAARGYAKTVPIIIQPLGTNSSVDQTRLANFRQAQYDMATEVSDVYMAPSTLTIDRLAPDDWHAKPKGFPNGYDKMASDLAATVYPRLLSL